MSTPSIPIIDMAGGAVTSSREKARLAAQIGAASRTVGFFYVVNHGVPDHLLGGQLEWARRFFELPLETKLAIDFRNAGRRGYEPIALQTLQAGMQPDQKEGFTVGRDPAPEDLAQGPASAFAENQWPADAPGFDAQVFRAQVEGYRDALIGLGREICGLIALSLGLPDDHFAEPLSRPTVTVRSLHYPPLGPDAPADLLGAGAHTDWGLITLLLQDDCGGLEVEAAGTWIKATPVPGAFIVNLGDMVPRMTGGLYASNVHRVRNLRPDRDRYSVATFFNPPGDYLVDYVPTCEPAGERLPPTTFSDHIVEMGRRTYGAGRENPAPQMA